jgi:flagellin
MSFRINYNHSATTAQTNASAADRLLSASIQRLSTGLKINQSKDDPSGLMASEGLRNKLSALEELSRNHQSALGMVKTGERALGEISALLGQLRALTVQAGNVGSLDTTQLAALATQAQEMLASMDRIVADATWGGKSLLDSAAGVSTHIVSAAAVESAVFTGKINKIPLANGLVTLTQTVQGTREEVQGTVVYPSPANVVTAGIFTINGEEYRTDGLSVTLSDLIAQINSNSREKGVFAEARPVAGGFVLTVSASMYGSKHNVQITDPSGIMSHVANPPPTTNGADAEAEAEVTTEAGVQTITLKGAQGASRDGLLLEDPEGNRIRLDAAGNDLWLAGAPLVVANTTTGNGKQIQTGLEAGDVGVLQVGDMRVAALGAGPQPGKTLKDINLTVSGGVAEALTIIDQALDDVNARRADLGTYQRQVLEIAENRAATNKETWTNYDSQIRDTDMALEMTEYTKRQLLSQTALSILSQTNQDAQQVLNLLR